MYGWGGLQLFLCVRPWARFLFFVSRVLAQESFPVGSRGGRAEGNWHVSRCPVHPVSSWSQESPRPSCLFPTSSPGGPSPHFLPFPFPKWNPFHPAVCGPQSLPLVLGASRTLSVSFFSLDSQGGFSSIHGKDFFLTCGQFLRTPLCQAFPGELKGESF